MARADDLYLTEMLEAAEPIFALVKGERFDAFTEDKNLRGAVFHDFTMLGEVATNVSTAAQQRYPHIPWRNAVELRDHVVHGWFAVAGGTAWRTAEEIVPRLIPERRAMMERSSGSPRRRSRTRRLGQPACGSRTSAARSGPLWNTQIPGSRALDAPPSFATPGRHAPQRVAVCRRSTDCGFRAIGAPQHRPPFPRVGGGSPRAVTPRD